MKGNSKKVPLNGSWTGYATPCLILIGICFLFFIIRPFQSIIVTSNRAETQIPWKIKVLPKLDEAALADLPKEAYSYLAIIDAGSSGCRAHIYRYGHIGHSKGAIYVVPEHTSLKVKPGLSTFANNPSQAGESLQGLIDFMKEKIDESEWSKTPIWLKATAGLRLLPSEQSQAIIDSVRQYLMTSPFYFLPTNAKIISGKEEGAMSWLSVNYLLHVVGPFAQKDAEPYAVVEMGGASTQVTQLATDEEDINSIHKNYKYSFTVQGRSYMLYTHSYLGYGGDRAREALNNHLKSKIPTSTPQLEDPCLNPGFSKKENEALDIYAGPNGPFTVVGVADEKGVLCHEAIEAALFENHHNVVNNIVEVKTSQHLRTEGIEAKLSALGCTKETMPFSFNCVHQPEFVKQSKNFLVFENFFYAASGIGVQEANHPEPVTSKPAIFPLVTNPQEFAHSAEDVCKVSWDSIKTLLPVDNQPKEQNSKWCFLVSYAYLFLTHGLGLHDHQTITVRQTVGKADIDWALGAAYAESSALVKWEQ